MAKPMTRRIGRSAVRQKHWTRRPNTAAGVYAWIMSFGAVSVIQELAGIKSGPDDGAIANEIMDIIYSSRRTHRKRVLLGEGSVLSATLDLMETVAARKFSADERELIADKIKKSLNKQPKAA